MARLIILSLNNEEAKFEFKKISRANLYGSKKRVFLDSQDEVCQTAVIDKMYGILIQSGDASSVYMDSQQNYIEKENIVGLDEDGSLINRIDSTLNISQKLKKITIEEFLNFSFTSLYSLTQIELPKALEESLTQGEIFSFNFNYYSDFRVETGILLKNDDGLFALIGKKNIISWADKEALPTEHFESPDDGEIDFEML
tara:strand:- start:342 stop:938 length:597 start_codon:yes stop_codon:yes gene_type:complete